jgi:hypothetical protein
MKVAVLFCQTNGVYFGDDRFDPWDEPRDARKYSGPFPVIAHPPCQRWGRLGYANFHRWGGEHNMPGNDGGCFLSALNSVRAYSGVIEHPASSMAWKEFGLTRPSIGWTQSSENEWVCEVWQSAYGHRANKATWLLLVSQNKPHELDWSRTAGTHQVGFQDKRGKLNNKPTLSKKEANMTPLLFKEELYKLSILASFEKKAHP